MANSNSGSFADVIPSYKTRPPRGPSKHGGFLIGSCPAYKLPTLPDVFALPIKDSGMEPMLSPGEEGIFTSDPAIVAEPDPGSCVLVGTIFGPEIRQYEPLGLGEWAACALNPEYEDIRTADEAAWIIAVLVGVRDIGAIPAASFAAEVANV